MSTDRVQGTRPDSPARAWAEQHTLIDQALAGDPLAIDTIMGLPAGSWIRGKYEEARP